VGRTTRVNGYEVEEAPNGAWWVRQPGGHHAWRFATKLDAVRFAQRRRPPPADRRDTRSARPPRRAG
jgi:hypothetical protein